MSTCLLLSAIENNVVRKDRTDWHTMQDNDSGLRRRSPFHSLGSTPLRRTVILLLLLAGTYLVLPRMAGAADTLKLLRQADAIYLAAALAMQILSLLSNAYLVHQAAPAFGPTLSFRDVLQVTLASQFTALFIPSAGLSGIALRARYFSERGCALETTLCTYALEMLGQAIGIALAVVLALVALTVTGHGAPWWMLVPLLGGILPVWIALSILIAKPRQGDWRHIVLGWVNRVLVKLGRTPLSMATIEQRLGQVREAVAALSTPLRVRLALAGLGRAVTDILCLQMTLLAFEQAMPLHWTTIGYAMSSVLAYLSASPGGLVVTEGSLLAILARQGIPLALGMTVTLTYRLFGFWLPRILGLVAFLNLQRQSKQPLW